MWTVSFLPTRYPCIHRANPCESSTSKTGTPCSSPQNGLPHRHYYRRTHRGCPQTFRRIRIKPCLYGSRRKNRNFQKWLDECGLRPDEVMYMGDDIPDYEVMQIAGLPACPADAAPEIKQIARYISPFGGGQGCGRDIIEQILRAQGKWMSDKTAFGW